MSGVNSSADIEIDIRRFLKEHTTYKRSAVLRNAPVGVFLIVAECVFGVFKHLIYCNNALCDKIDAVDISDRGARRCARI